MNAGWTWDNENLLVLTVVSFFVYDTFKGDASYGYYILEKS